MLSYIIQEWVNGWANFFLVGPGPGPLDADHGYTTDYMTFVSLSCKSSPGSGSLY